MLEHENEEREKRIKSGALEYSKGVEFIFNSSNSTELGDTLNILYQEKKLDILPKL